MAPGKLARVRFPMGGAPTGSSNLRRVVVAGALILVEAAPWPTSGTEITLNTTKVGAFFGPYLPSDLAPPAYPPVPAPVPTLTTIAVPEASSLVFVGFTLAKGSWFFEEPRTASTIRLDRSGHHVPPPLVAARYQRFF